MSKKKMIPYLVIVTIFSSVLFFVFYNNSLKMTNKSIGATVTPIASDDTILINAAKVMFSENKDIYEGKVEIIVKDLIDNNYLSKDEINPLSNVPYSENIRIFATVNNGNVSDIYVKNEFFRNAYSCESVCYIDNDYIIYDNSVYRVLKVDSDGYTYITNTEVVEVYKDNIDSKLKYVYNKADKSIVKSVVSITNSDLESNIIDNDKNLFVNTSLGYRLYDSNINDIVSVENIKSNLMVVIILRNDVTYELGDGSKVNPYVVTN